MTQPRNYPYTKMFLDAIVLTLFVIITTVLSLGLLLGSSLSAYYKTLFRAKRFDTRAEHLLKQYIEDLKSTIPASIIMMVIIYIVFASLIFLINTFDDQGSQLLFYFMLFETVIITLYFFPSLGIFKFENIPHAFKTLGLMANFHFFTTIKALVPFALLALSVIYISPYLIFLALTFYLFISIFSFHKTFMVYVQRIETEPKEDEVIETVPTEAEDKA